MESASSMSCIDLVIDVCFPQNLILCAILSVCDPGLLIKHFTSVSGILSPVATTCSPSFDVVTSLRFPEAVRGRFSADLCVLPRCCCLKYGEVAVSPSSRDKRQQKPGVPRLVTSGACCEGFLGCPDVNVYLRVSNILSQMIKWCRKGLWKGSFS